MPRLSLYGHLASRRIIKRFFGHPAQRDEIIFLSEENVTSRLTSHLYTFLSLLSGNERISDHLLCRLYPGKEGCIDILSGRNFIS